MLEYLRNASEKPVAKVLIGILSFSFVGWGVAEWIFGGGGMDTTLLKVGNSEIAVQQFSTVKSGELAKLSREEQRAIYSDAQAQGEFNQQVLKKITMENMLQNRANDLGFVVTDRRVAREIREYPEFQDNGHFSTRLFEQLLFNSGLSEADFAAYLRNQTLRSMVLVGVAKPLPVPEFVQQATYNARYAERDVEYATVKYSDFSVAEPTEEQLSAFYKQNPRKIPETRSVSYVLIKADMVQPDKYDAGYALAIKVEDDIIAGETMADTAKKHDVTYVALDAFERGQRPADKVLTDAVVAKIFDMDEGLESEMIETKDGFLFVRVDKVNPEHIAEFESVKQSLVADWKKAEQKKLAYLRANELLVDLNKNGKLPQKKSARVSRASGAPTDVLVAAFRSGVGENLIVEGADVFYVLRVNKDIQPSLDTKKIADLRNEVQDMLNTGVTEDYNSFLKREYPIEINEKVYSRFVGE